MDDTAAWAKAVVDSVATDPPPADRATDGPLPVRRVVDPEMAEEPVRADLRAVGSELSSVWRFEPSTAAQVEVLLDHLARPYTRWVKERMLLALARSAAAAAYRDHFVALIREVAAHEQAARTERELMRHQPLAMCAAHVIVRTRRMTRRDRVALIDDQSLGRTRTVFMHHMRVTSHRADLERWAADPDVGDLAADKLAGRRRP